MSEQIAVALRNVSKMYRLFASKSDRVREALNPFRRTYHREFWALKDITLDIPRGHTVGILGLNGSGKSTLLQIISSVLQPTSGSVQVNGKVAALLELGAGFNPELTGRENVILNGTILGLGREEIAARMDEIQTFADIGEFFDQPMKTYSSGMFMRVAFSTALYVDPEILIIDEALSVGDAKFQEKCFRRFKAFQDAGKTILFVTHDRSAVPRLCNLGILLHQGQLVMLGEPGRVVELYGEILAFGSIRMQEAQDRNATGTRSPDHEPSRPDARSSDPKEQEQPCRAEAHAFVSDMSPEDRCHLNPTYNKYEHRYGNERAAIIDYLLVQGPRINPTAVETGRTLDVYIKIRFEAEIQNPLIGLSVQNKEGVLVYGTHSGWLGARTPDVASGSVHTYRFSVRPSLNVGPWFFQLAVAETQADMCDLRSNVVYVEVMPSSPFDGLAMLDTSFEPMA